MSTWREITNIWKNVREVDLRPIRQEALVETDIAVAGEEGSGRRALARQLRMDPKREDVETHTPVVIGGLQEVDRYLEADLIVIMVKPNVGDVQRWQRLAKDLTNAGKKVVVFRNISGASVDASTLDLPATWEAAHVFTGTVEQHEALFEGFVNPILDILPDLHLSLGRRFPLFRVPIAHRLINDTSFSNAAYAVSTSLAEMVPALGLPINIADVVVLTKAQAFLVYRLGLVVGFSTRWQDYVAEFGSVIGGGFMWRQLARSLVGMIPIVGMIPKVAVAYAGTYVVGHVVLRWYMTGRHVSPRQIRQMYRDAFIQGKAVARNLLDKTPRFNLFRRKRAASLPSGSDVASDTNRLEGEKGEGKPCPHCGQLNSPQANYCQYCGNAYPA